MYFYVLYDFYNIVLLFPRTELTEFFVSNGSDIFT